MASGAVGAPAGGGGALIRPKMKPELNRKRAGAFDFFSGFDFFYAVLRLLGWWAACARPGFTTEQEHLGLVCCRAEISPV